MKSGQRRAVDDPDAETRRHLIEATQQLLGASGAAPVTSRAIAEAAEANLGAITYYFGSKENLIAEAMMALARSLLEPVADVLGSNRDPVSKLLDTIVVLDRTLVDHRPEAATYVQVLAAASSGAPIAAELRELLRMIEGLLTEQIELQQQADLLPSWIVPSSMAQVIVAVVHGTLVASAVDAERIDHTAIGAQFAQLLVAARATSQQGGP